MQLSCQLTNSHQASTVENQVDYNEQGIKLKTYRGYRKKVVGKTSEDLKWIRDPQISVGKCNRQYPTTSPLYVFPITLGLALEGLSLLPFRT
jgi:hypothetical protein